MWERLVTRRWTPMGRRDLAWLTIFRNPLTRLSRPAGNVAGPARIMFENNSCSISRGGLDGTAHCEDAYRYRAITSPFLKFTNLFPGVRGPQYALPRYR